MSKFDPTKPVQTRSGLKARIICTDRNHPKYPIVALVEDDGIESAIYVTKEGTHMFNPGYNTAYTLDLINIPERPPHADLIIAWANGAKIEYYSTVEQKWDYIEKPKWNKETEYRIAPEQK